MLQKDGWVWGWITIPKNSWLGTDIVIRKSTGKRGRKGDDILDDYGY
jgi:hypothetical protein